ncbi:subtilisin family serine protease [Motilibacter peucedani]|uniref:Subtilisin family serine protease n=1 Tax=Motilibacter peucedani TaxID=598650 RepID=A0A420XPG4_9ACTN|nr:S8 family serine peptidase [Motilibacter peucedani]RKS74075.1 subtilisin family serine protease [Motilibacter peucedani]
MVRLHSPRRPVRAAALLSPLLCSAVALAAPAVAAADTTHDASNDALAAGSASAELRALPAPLLGQLDVSERLRATDALTTGTDGVPVALTVREGTRLQVVRLRAENGRARALVALLDGQPSVESAGLDTVATASDVSAAAAYDDPYRSMQWALDRLRHDQVSALPVAGPAPVVAVIDTGIQGSHPDLAGVQVAGYDAIRGTAIAPGTATDPNGHGTHVAGIIGAVGGNGVGVTGFLRSARIMPVRVLGSAGTGLGSTIAQGMIWAVDHGAKVLNLSLGGSGVDAQEQAAVDYAEAHGALVVAAAGNQGDAANPVEYPAGFVKTLAVGATAQAGDAIAPYSTHGPQVDISAPGDQVTSTYPTSVYANDSGTSMATPYVAAAAALDWAAHPSFTPADLRDHLVRTAEDLGAPGRDDFFGAGLVDPLAALTDSAPASTGSPTPDPAATAPATPTPEPTTTPAPSEAPVPGATPEPTDGPTPGTGPETAPVPDPVEAAPAFAVTLAAPAAGPTGVVLRPVVTATGGAVVSDVDLQVDGRLVAVDRSEPYRLYVAATALRQGRHSFVVTVHGSAPDAWARVSAVVRLPSAVELSLSRGVLTVQPAMRPGARVQELTATVDGRAAARDAAEDGTGALVRHLPRGSHAVRIVLVDQLGAVTEVRRTVRVR